MNKSREKPLRHSVAWFFAALIILYLLTWAPFWFYFIKFYFFSSHLYVEDNFASDLKTMGLELHYPVDTVPTDCTADDVGYHIFSCNDMSLSVKLLERGQARVVVTSFPIPGIAERRDEGSGNRILLRKEGSKLAYDVIDHGSIDQNYPLRLQCVVTEQSKPNIFGIYTIKEICGYKGSFLYTLVGMAPNYGFPYNLTGNAVMPLQVFNWIDSNLREKVVK